MATVCYYDDKEFSEGSIIEVEGEYLECVSSGDGEVQWQEAKEVPKDPKGDSYSPGRLASGDPKVVAKKTGICLYEGKRYSVGAKIKMPNGSMKMCVNKGGGGTKWDNL